jgi:DNA polymerase-3 subunit epsilon
MSSLTMAGVAFALYHALPENDREVAARLLSATGELPYLLTLMLFAITGFLASWIAKWYFRPLAIMAEATSLINASNPDARLTLADGAAVHRPVVEAINALAERHAAAVTAMDARIREARATLEQEKNRLAVLMSELAEGVIVSSAEGRILLYNVEARRIIAAGEAHARGFVGLGRSLFDVFPKAPIRHAMERLHARTLAGELDPIAMFTTGIGAGTTLRIRMAPMAGMLGETSDSTSGYVLLLEDAGRDILEIERRDRIVIDLIEQSRAALASLTAATENLSAFPDMPPAQRARFLEIAIEEAKRLTHAVEGASRSYTQQAKRRPRALEPMRAAELIEVIGASLRKLENLRVRAESDHANLWVNVDSHALVQLFRYLARRLHGEFKVPDLQLVTACDDTHVYFDLLWPGMRLATPTALAWEEEPLSAGGEPTTATVREFVELHGGEFWQQIGPAPRPPRFRLMLPQATQPLANTQQIAKGRPVFYDFDLFALGAHGELADFPLERLSYTVFDTETTGLEPSEGDEIISIGAVRIVNSRMLTAEAFDQLVNPHRPIAPASVKIHGIRDEMLVGEPDIDTVLPLFSRYCADTVLVGHNVAFDMRFLQLKEERTGIRFRQPVLDTLLLSAVLHENIGDDRLEAIAHRLGIEVVARHSAVGDALVTAEIFLKMIPLLASRGIRTLREALDATGRTRYAKLRY